MTNPFVYGEIVPAAAFVDREVELDRLGRDLLAGQKVFLISPRRYGKSSLVRQALRGAGRGGALTVDVTGQQLQLLRRVPRGLRPRAGASAETRLDARASWLREHARRRPAGGARRARRRGRASSPSPSRSRGAHRPRRLAPRPGGLRAARPHRRGARRKLAIALDEFQAIGAFNGGSVEHALRAAVQQQRRSATSSPDRSRR